MKLFKNIALSLTALFILSSCQSEQPVKTMTDKTSLTSAATTPEDQEHKQVITEPVAANTNPLSSVYSAYFDLKNALVASDGPAAAAQAKILFAALSAVKMETMQPDQHAVWMKFQQKLIDDAGKIQGDTDIKQKRERFASLSKNMYSVMQAIKPETEVYYEHCPMYNDGKGGNWLSTEKAIRNPYYGKQMMTCGSVIETLK